MNDFQTKGKKLTALVPSGVPAPFLLPFHIYQGNSLDSSCSSFSSYKLSSSYPQP